ncbi:ATP-dependent nuclease [Glutamicibacter sp. AGC46]
MYIRSVLVENVKSFREKHRFELHPGVNFFVGDNNSGKSTVLEALLFMFEGPSSTRWTPEKFYCNQATGPTRVEVDIADGLDDLVAQEKFKVLSDFVFEDDGQMILRLERSSESRTVVQGGKNKSIDVKAVCFWHPERQQFENVTGIDAKVKAIFDFEAVWADAQPGDHIDFANTKTLGRLLDSSFKQFVETEPWKALAKAHKRAFALDEEDSFMAETKALATEIKALVDDQYGKADYRFDFGLPDAAVFMKQGRLHVDDGAGETLVEGKGSGMQRAIALGIIQLYARSSALADDSNPTPLVLMLDEPETWLHPSAQLKLGEALSQIGTREQVFIITHSPYLIRKFDSKSHMLTVLAGHGKDRRVDHSTKFGLFGQGEPTWGEINYRAFDVCSNDFHNELYGHVQRHIEAQKADGKSATEKEMDLFLVAEGIDKAKTWVRNPRVRYPATLPVYVRNSIHHPENSMNLSVTAEELHNSTRVLLGVVERINARP